MLKKSPAVISPIAGKWAWALGVILLAALLPAWPAWALQPVLPGRWLQARTPHFRFYYLPGDESLLATVAEVAERSHDWATADLKWDPGIVNVTLLTYTDLINGMTTPIPDTRIRLYLTPPDSASSLISYRDWVEMLFLHEYIHAVHLDMAHGPTMWLRYLMGRRALTTVDTIWGDRNPVSSGLQIPVIPFVSTVPNALLMPWETEGLAAAYESWGTGRGRLLGPYGRMVVRTAALHNAIPDWSDMASKDFLAWPYGSSWYLYGARYMAWINAHKGRKVLVKWQHDNAWGFFPFFSWLSLATAGGGSMTNNWEDMRSEENNASHLLEDQIEEPPFKVLDGASVTRQPVTDGRSVFWLKSDGSKPEVIREWQPGWGQPRTVSSARTVNRLAVNTRWLISDPYDFVDEYRLQRRLVARRRRDGKTWVLRDSLRLTDPALDEHNNLYAVRRLPKQSTLIRGKLASDGSIRWQKRPLVVSKEAILTPVPSPDGTRLVYVIHQRGTDHDLWLYDLKNGSHSALVSWPGEELFPVWLDNHRLRFASSRNGRFLLYEINVETRKATLLINTVTGLFGSVSVADQLVATRYDVNGFSVVRYAENLSPATLPKPAALPVGAMPAGPIDPHLVFKGPYQPWRSLLPRYWMPLLWLQAGKSLTLKGFGASTGGEDILGHHRWGATLFSDLQKWRPSWAVSYRYDGADPFWHLSLAGGQDYTSYLGANGHANFFDRINFLSSGATILRPGINTSSSGSLVFNYLSYEPADRIRRPGSQAYGWQAGPGLRFVVSTMTRTPLIERGHDGVSLALAGDLMAAESPGQQIDGSYVAIFKATATAAKSLFWSNRLSLTLEAGSAAGHSLRSRAFTLVPVDSSHQIASNYKVTRRGFNVSLSGSQLFYSGLQLSQPLWFAQEGWRWFPFLFRRLDLHLFVEAADVNSSWSRIRPEPVYGAELRASGILAQVIPLDFVFGWAQPVRNPKNWLLYFAPTSRF